MNILVTGANGQLGNEMRIIAGKSSDSYIFTDVNQVEGLETTFLDITDIEAVRAVVASHNVNAIVNCAAWTNVDAAEDPDKYEIVERLNATAPENLAIAMKEVGGLLVQISTDYVFGKEPYNTPCREDQKGTPTGVYGLTKLHGEQKIMDSGCDYVIIRTAWLYSEFGKNFCKTMLSLTATKPSLKVVFDQVGTPTYAWDLAVAIAAVLADFGSSLGADSCGRDAAAREHFPYFLRSGGSISSACNDNGCSAVDASSQKFGEMLPDINSPACNDSGCSAVNEGRYGKTGIYHFSNEGVCSWYDFTKMIAEYSGQTSCDVQPCHSNEFPSSVVRPSFSVLDKTKIKETFNLSIPYWTESLKICIKNLQQ